MAVFSNCEKVALVDGELDKETFKNCFTAQRAAVERKYPGAFDFMANGFEFLLLMMGIFFLYFYAVKPKIDGMLGGDPKEEFDYGAWVKDLGKSIWNIPTKIGETVEKATGKK